MVAHAQAPPTNRTLLDSCVARVVRSAAAHWGASRVDVRIDSSRDAVLIAAPAFRAASERGGTIPAAECRVRLTEAETRYRATGDDRIVRSVSVRAAFSLFAPGSATLAWAGEESSSAADTIRCGDVVTVERGEGIPAAHAADPCVDEASALTSLIEPLVLAVASATIVVLLFTIRGR